MGEKHWCERSGCSSRCSNSKLIRDAGGGLQKGLSWSGFFSSRRSKEEPAIRGRGKGRELQVSPVHTPILRLAGEPKSQ